MTPFSCADPQGRITYWNQSAAHLYGWTKEAGSGAGWPTSSWHTRFPEPLLEIESHLVEHGHWEGELVHTTRRTAASLTMDTRWSVKRDDQGRVVAILEINRDITAQKRSRAGSHRLASFPLLNPNPVLEVDEDGGVVYANPAAQRVAGDLELKAGLRDMVPRDLKEYFARAAPGRPPGVCPGCHGQGEGLHRHPVPAPRPADGPPCISWTSLCAGRPRRP